MKKFTRQPANKIVQWADLEPILRELEWWRGLSIAGAEYKETSGGPVINISKKGGGDTGGSSTTNIEANKDMFYARITNYVGIRATNQGGARHFGWEYDFERVLPIAYTNPGNGLDSGWIAWGNLYGKCFNILEVINEQPSVSDPNPIMGNGVDLGNLIANFPDFNIQPCPIGAVVVMWRTDEGAGGSSGYWFQYSNGVDGACS